MSGEGRTMSGIVTSRALLPLPGDRTFISESANCMSAHVFVLFTLHFSILDLQDSFLTGKRNPLHFITRHSARSQFGIGRQEVHDALPGSMQEGEFYPHFRPDSKLCRARAHVDARRTSLVLGGIKRDRFVVHAQ